MELSTTHNLSHSDFIRMFERDATTPLELALFSRLTELEELEHQTFYAGGEGFQGKMGDLVGDIEDRLVTVENEIEDTIEIIDDLNKDDMFKKLAEFSENLEDVRDKLHNTYDAETATF